DHPYTLRSASILALALRELGRHEQARQLGEDTFTRLRRVLGEDHPDTLRTAHSLAAARGDSG
ncbi:MAG: tetratricopeptide repeat protein, partial [Pseudonocardiaceae bacterium]